MIYTRRDGKKFEIKEGLGCTIQYYSDAAPCQIVKVEREGKAIYTRGIPAELDPSWKPETIVGGFCGHTVNNREQKWIYGEVENDGHEYDNGIGMKWTLRKNGHYYPVGEKMGMSKALYIGSAYKFYDYNF